jgi:hypothetical protein
MVHFEIFVNSDGSRGVVTRGAYAKKSCRDVAVDDWFGYSLCTKPCSLQHVTTLSASQDALLPEYVTR